MQNTKSYVDSLFNGYEETKNLAEFKEELTSHLNDKIADLVKNGSSENEAFAKASAELGDISAIADEMSLKKKQEVYSEMYMGTRKYLTPKRTLLFVLGGAVIFFGLLISALTWFSTEDSHASLASGMFFVALGTGLLTYMGLTQETASNNPMPWKRAIVYAVSVSLFLFGLLCGVMVYLAIMAELNPADFASHGWEHSLQNLGFTSAIGVLLAFVLPSAALFIYMTLTEKDRAKPWVKQMREKEAALFANPATQMRFGLFSGAIWITAIALFVLIGFAASFKISWLVFLFAVAVQLLVQAVMIKRES